MRKLLFIATVWMISSCGGTESKTDATTIDSTFAVNKAGADKDAHGCIGSAGYTWSVVKDSCIRPFEAGTKFINYGSNTDSSQAAHVLLSKDKTKAEVFFALTDKPAVLDAVAVMEGDIAPILFENKTEMVDIISRKEVYYIRFKNDPKFSQQADISNGLSILLKK